MQIRKAFYKDSWGNKQTYYLVIESEIIWAKIFPCSSSSFRYWFQRIGEGTFLEDMKATFYRLGRKPRKAWVIQYADTKRKQYDYKYFLYLENAKKFAARIVKEKLGLKE